MQKYRRWTDEATGINPFIKAKTTPMSLVNLIKLALIAVLKINIIILLFIPIGISLLLQNSVMKPAILKSIIAFPIKILNILLGLWSVDDDNFKRWTHKNTGKDKGKLILSNQVSILDPFYFMNSLSPVKFIIVNSEQNKFQAIGGISAFLRLISDKQPFFVQKQFKSLIEAQINKGYNCILFYQGIRTNGLGTIKISKKLSNQIFQLQQNYCVVHLKYTSAPQGLFSLVTHPLILLLSALGTCSISLRVRSNPVSIDSQNSSSDVSKDLDNFLMANASKLLDTVPSSYYQFLQFYFKTQSTGYTQVSQDAEGDK